MARVKVSRRDHLVPPAEGNLCHPPCGTGGKIPSAVSRRQHVPPAGCGLGEMQTSHQRSRRLFGIRPTTSGPGSCCPMAFHLQRSMDLSAQPPCPRHSLCSRCGQSGKTKCVRLGQDTTSVMAPPSFTDLCAVILPSSVQFSHSYQTKTLLPAWYL